MCVFARKDSQEVFVKQVRRKQHLNEDLDDTIFTSKMLPDYIRIYFLIFSWKEYLIIPD